MCGSLRSQDLSGISVFPEIAAGKAIVLMPTSSLPSDKSQCQTIAEVLERPPAMLLWSSTGGSICQKQHEDNQS